MNALAFIDTETTGLDPERHEMWEIAVISREADSEDWESHYQIRKTALHLAHGADPEALDIGRYYDRMVVPAGEQYAQIDSSGKPFLMSRQTLVEDLTRKLKGATLVGSNPAFDAAFLRVFLDGAPWHYRTVDVATLAAGYRHGQAASGAYGREFAFSADLPAVPYSSRSLSRAVGVEPPGPGVAHTALGDARWARDVYDAVTVGIRCADCGDTDGPFARRADHRHVCEVHAA